MYTNGQSSAHSIQKPMPGAPSGPFEDLLGQKVIIPSFPRIPSIPAAGVNGGKTPRVPALSKPGDQQAMEDWMAEVKVMAKDIAHLREKFDEKLDNLTETVESNVEDLRSLKDWRLGLEAQVRLLKGLAAILLSGQIITILHWLFTLPSRN